MVRGQGEYCAYCKRELVAYTATHPTRDHVFPKSRGGRKTVWACTTCNNIKGAMLPEGWEIFMRRFPEWWKIPGREAAGRRATAVRRPPPVDAMPKVYDDHRKQAGFEAIYRDRLHLLSKLD